MTLSTKPEIHDVSQRHQKRTKPRPQAPCTTILVKFDRVVFELCKRTDRHTTHHTKSTQDSFTPDALQTCCVAPRGNATEPVWTYLEHAAT